MIEKLIRYFSERHLLANLIVVGVFVGAVLVWQFIYKESMPNVNFGRVSITVSYPGASPTEVEYFIAKPIENALKGMAGIREITSRCDSGSCRVSLDIDPDIPGYETLVSDIRSEVLNIRFPEEVTSSPRIREFKPSEFAVMNVGLMITNVRLLDEAGRKELQKYADSFVDLLEALPEVSEAAVSGYLNARIVVRINPRRMEYYQLSFDQVVQALKSANLRTPVGSLDTENQEKVTIDAELVRVEDLRNLPIQTSFSSRSVVTLQDVADVGVEYEERTSLQKFDGSEGVQVEITKSGSHDVIEASDAIRKFLKDYDTRYLSGTALRTKILRDDSLETRNRLSIIASNGIIGFILVILVLVIFLTLDSAFWVAAGIPVSFGFALILAPLFGLTVNSMTLAGVIIVMGMIVDDAIVVSENVERLRSQGMGFREAVVKGASAMFLPILASILTTCVAFVALYFFGGRFGKFAQVIPMVIFLILGGRFLDALLIMPGHLTIKLPRWVLLVFSLGTLPLVERWIEKRQARAAHSERKTPSKKTSPAALAACESRHWFDRVECFYERILNRVLKRRWIVLGIFVALLALSLGLFAGRMKFVLFPTSETTRVFISGSAPAGTPLRRTALAVEPLEDILREYLGRELVSYTTSIGVSRMGSSRNENNFNIMLELVTADKRKKSTDQMIREWESRFRQGVTNLSRLTFLKRRFGQSSGTPIEIRVSANSDEIRDRIITELSNIMETDARLTNVEVERQETKTEYRIRLKREDMKKLGVSADSVSYTLKSTLQGITAYTFTQDEKEIDVIVRASDGVNRDIRNLLDLPVRNNQGYLIRLRQISAVDAVATKDSIQRIQYRRVANLYSDLAGSTRERQPDIRPDRPVRPGANQNREQSGPRRPAGPPASPAPQAGPAEALTVIPELTNRRQPKNATPLEIADFYETSVFPVLLQKFPQAFLAFAGEVKDTRESQSDMVTGLILVLVMIYGILAILFNSLSRPFLIMCVIPFGIIGVVLAFWLHGKFQIGFFTGIGIIGLAGVVVNDSIIMVDKLDREFKKLKPKDNFPAHVAAIAKTRLRAIILTTVTTVAGLLPTAYGIGGYDDFVSDMMLAMSWGLAFATFITLFLLPSLYAILLDFRRKREKIRTEEHP